MVAHALQGKSSAGCGLSNMCAGGRAGRQAGARNTHRRTHCSHAPSLPPPPPTHHHHHHPLSIPQEVCCAHRDGRTPPMLEGPLWTSSVVKLGGRVSWTGAASGRLICSSSCPWASTARFTTSRPLRVSNLTLRLWFWHSAGGSRQINKQAG